MSAAAASTGRYTAAGGAGRPGDPVDVAVAQCNSGVAKALRSDVRTARLSATGLAHWL
jgi:hypothetical protein